jgi:hypothetical protein
MRRYQFDYAAGDQLILTNSDCDPSSDLEEVVADDLGLSSL